VAVEIAPEQFEELVVEALDELPEEMASLMDNVAVVVDHDTAPGQLMGLYEGIPLTERDEYGGLVTPDIITVFRRSICESCENPDEVRDEVRVTVVHEVAHHFGISDERLHELGWD
jgi:predicted Zn-dependent protease with MMP-like domain